MGPFRGTILGLALVCALPSSASHMRAWPEIDGVRYHPNVGLHNPFDLLDPDKVVPTPTPKVAPSAPAAQPEILKDLPKRPSRKALRQTLDTHYNTLRAAKGMVRHKAIAALKKVCMDTSNYGDVPDFQKMWARAFYDLGKLLSPLEAVCLDDALHNREACFRRAYEYVRKTGSASQEASVLYKLLRCTKEPAMLLDGRWTLKAALFSDVVNLADARDKDLIALSYAGILDFWVGGFVMIAGNQLHLRDCMEEAHKTLEKAPSLEVRSTCLISLARHVNGFFGYCTYASGAHAGVPVHLLEVALYERAADLTHRPHKRTSSLLSALEARVTAHASAFKESVHKDLMTRLFVLEPLIPESCIEMQVRHARLQERLMNVREEEIRVRGPSCIVFS